MSDFSDFAIDPELRIRANPERVLRCTNDAVKFIREMMLSRRGHQWRNILQRFEGIRDEWTGMEAVVHLELLLEAERMLIEQEPLQPPTTPQYRSKAA
jgi:hypothetical protein